MRQLFVRGDNVVLVAVEGVGDGGGGGEVREVQDDDVQEVSDDDVEVVPVEGDDVKVMVKKRKG